MLEIILSAEAETRLKAAFSEFKGSENVFFRIHEVKVGSTWYAHTELRLMLDNGGPYENEISGTFCGIPFVLHPDMADYYGECFEITIAPSGAFFILAHERMDFLLLSR